jgi:YHS domain-containing protein
MSRFILLLLLCLTVIRILWRTYDAFIEGATGRRRSGPVPPRAVPMVRDPVCGTFVVADRAVTLVEGRSRLFFCSEGCRDKYRARTA